MTFVAGLLKPGLWLYVLPVVLLVCSNVFMTIAWYGHLKFKAVPLVTVVLVSWGIAFVEYWFAVPANRIGSAVYSPAELKTMQEVITLLVFAVFTAVYFNEPLSWTQGAGFLLIALGAALVFHGQG
ncbi:MAG: DMT family protein [Methyloceanibacter sp.]|uniref:DMT family protein n=1 Tax=Methyloceanibacter sp. TaxID=1965321 RepID=UPI003D6C98CA